MNENLQFRRRCGRSFTGYSHLTVVPGTTVNGDSCQRLGHRQFISVGSAARAAAVGTRLVLELDVQTLPCSV